MSEIPDIRKEDLIAMAITEAFGERCDDFGELCPCCLAWKQYDDLQRRPYISREPKDGYRSVASFSEAERTKLRPVAETLAMLDGNAFLGMGDGPDYWSDQYLPEADALYQSNGGDTGWASEASFARARSHPETGEG